MNSICRYFDRIGAFKKPTNAGFAISSPSAPWRLVSIAPPSRHKRPGKGILGHCLETLL